MNVAALPAAATCSSFVNLPIRYVREHPQYLDLFLSQRIAPELGFDAWALETLSQDWHARTAAIFHDAGLRCAVHLPFFDLHPGSLDPWARAVCERRLIQAMTVARIYNPAHFIAHLDFNPMVYALHEATWLENSVQTWTRVLEHADATPVFLENVHEGSPQYQCMILRELGDKARACFDVGHWHSFGEGYAKNDLAIWLNTLGPYLGHLHLHDNDGSGDQHLGLGQGTIPWEHLWIWLAAHPTPVTRTFEPHTETDYHATQKYLRSCATALPL